MRWRRCAIKIPSTKGNIMSELTNYYKQRTLTLATEAEDLRGQVEEARAAAEEAKADAAYMRGVVAGMKGEPPPETTCAEIEEGRAEGEAWARGQVAAGDERTYGVKWYMRENDNLSELLRRACGEAETLRGQLNARAPQAHAQAGMIAGLKGEPMDESCAPEYAESYALGAAWAAEPKPRSFAFNLSDIVSMRLTPEGVTAMKNLGWGVRQLVTDNTLRGAASFVFAALAEANPKSSAGLVVGNVVHVERA